MLDFDLRMEHAALQGAATRTPTLAPFVSEAVSAATSDLDKTQEEIEAFNVITPVYPFPEQNGG
jgi:hypothetical protein